MPGRFGEITSSVSLSAGQTLRRNSGDTSFEAFSPASLSGGTFTGPIVASGHGTATNAEVVGICYGTGAAPSAAGVPEGTLYITYTA